MPIDLNRYNTCLFQLLKLIVILFLTSFLYANCIATTLVETKKTAGLDTALDNNLSQVINNDILAYKNDELFKLQPYNNQHEHVNVQSILKKYQFELIVCLSLIFFLLALVILYYYKTYQHLVLAKNKLKLAANVFEQTTDSIVITDPKANIIDINQSFTELTGYSKEEAIGKKTNLLNSGRHPLLFYQSMWKALLDKGEWKGQLWNKKKNGEVYAGLLSISAIREKNGIITHFIGICSDITQYLQQHEHLEFLAYHDSLTQLPNRILFNDRLKTAISLSRRSNNLLTVCYLDLDGFKPVNDTLGHQAGDKLLIEVAKRMLNCVREGDAVARLGGDEFALLLSNIFNLTEVEIILKRILSSIAAPYIIHNEQVNISASMGVTFYPMDDVDSNTMLKHADQAMYTAKTLGKNQYHIFNFHEDKSLQTRNQTIEQVEQGFLNNEFKVLYQPQINMLTGEVLSVQAQLFWQHPQRGNLSMQEFSSLITDSELSNHLEWWLFNTAMQQINDWCQFGFDLKLAINISSYHLNDKNFSHHILDIFNKYPQITANLVGFEVNEITLLEHVKEIDDNIEFCQNMGFSIILNDFGSGYSSLACCKRCSIDILKIDPKFVQSMLSNDEDYSVVDAIISLSHSFNHQLIVNGVDTEQHGFILLQMGCVVGQGNFISEVMEADQVLNWITHFKTPQRWKNSTNKHWKKEDMAFELVEYHHSAWVDKMIALLSDNSLQLTEIPITISHKKCFFGKWYQGIGKQNYGHLEEFVALDTKHEQIHNYVKHLMDLKKAGNFTLETTQRHKIYDLKQQLLDSVEKLKEKISIM